MTDDKEPEGFYLSNTKLISLLIGIVSTGIMAFCAVIYSDEQRTAAALTAHIIDDAKQRQAYIVKDDLGEINQRLQRIEDKLDNKVDKTK